MSTAAVVSAPAPSELWRARTKRLEQQRRNLPALFGAKETAQCLTAAGLALGLDPPLPVVEVSNLQYIADLPAPVEDLAATRVWIADEIRAFAEIYAARRAERAARRRRT